MDALKFLKNKLNLSLKNILAFSTLIAVASASVAGNTVITDQSVKPGSSGNLSMVGSGLTNITDTGKLEMGGDIDGSSQAINNIKGIGLGVSSVAKDERIEWSSGSTLIEGGNSNLRILSGGGDIDLENKVDLENNNLNNIKYSIAQEYTTVDNTSLVAIDKAIDNHDRVKLRPANYSGDHSITINSNNRDHVALLFQGAEITYFGQNAAINITDESSTDKVTVKGGALYGKTSGSSNYNGTVGVYFEDDGQNTIDLQYIHGFEHGIEGKNIDQWSEGTVINIEGSHEQRHVMHFKGASATGGTGTDSFRGTQIDTSHLHAIDGGALLYQDQANIYDSEILLGGFVPDNGKGWHLDGGIHESVVRVNIEGGTNNVGIDLGSNYDEDGIFMNPVIRPSNSWDNPNNYQIPIIDNNGGGAIEVNNTLTVGSIGSISQKNDVDFKAPINLGGNIKEINDAVWKDTSGGSSDPNKNDMLVTTGSNQFRMIPRTNGSNTWSQSWRYDFSESEWRIGYGQFRIDKSKLNATDNRIINVDYYGFHNESGQPIRFNEIGGELRVQAAGGSNIETVFSVPTAKKVDMENNTLKNTKALDNSVTDSMPSCSSSTKGEIRFNGSKHWGCDGSTWNKLY